MFKKILSVMLVALMIVSVGAVAVSAADVADVTVAADTSSSEVAAEENSDVAAAANTITFEQPDSWKNVKAMYCHVWMCVDDKSVKWPSWKSKAEKMTDNGDGTWTFDVSKLGANAIDPNKGAAYAVIFAADTGMQTYNLVFGADCIGDTAYVTGNTFENPEDSAKSCTEALWRSGKYGPEKKILSTGNDIVGTVTPAGATDATLMANWIKTFYADATKTPNVPSLLTKLNVTGQQVYDELVVITANDSEEDRNKILNGAAPLLGVEIKDASNPAASSSGTGSSNGGSSNGGSNNGGSGSTGSGSGSSGSGSTGSVSSGQDSTILFVLGGLMLAAAAVMFVTSKKRD